MLCEHPNWLKSILFSDFQETIFLKEKLFFNICNVAVNVPLLWLKFADFNQGNSFSCIFLPDLLRICNFRYPTFACLFLQMYYSAAAEQILKILVMEIPRTFSRPKNMISTVINRTYTSDTFRTENSILTLLYTCLFLFTSDFF